MGESFSTPPTPADKKRLKTVRNVLVGGVLSVGALGAGQGSHDTQPMAEAVSSSLQVAPENPSATVANIETAKVEGRDEQTPEWMPESVRQQWPQILESAKAHDVDPKLIVIFVAEESGGDAKAYNPSGASGLMQIMPVTAEFIAKARGIKKYDMLNAAQNLDFGGWYLNYLQKQFAIPKGIDSSSYVGRSILYVGMSGGVGDVQRLLQTGYNMNYQSKQTQEVSQLWEHMYQDWDSQRCLVYEKLRGK